MLKFAHDIAGGQGNLIATSVQSPNFVHGSTGWQVRKDGSVEFNNGIFRGYIIGGSLFIYSGTPALGNPPVFSVTSASTDPFGNTITPGIFAGKYGGVQAGLSTSGTIGLLSFPVPGSFSKLPEIGAGTSNSGAELEIQGPAESAAGQTDYFFQIYGSYSAGGGGGAFWQMTYVDPSGGLHSAITAGPGGVRLPVVAALTAVEPGTGTSPANPAASESWHSLSLTTATASGNGVNGMRYKLMPDNSLALEWDINTNSGNNVTIATLPAGWRPAKPHNIGSGSYGGSTALTSAQNPHLIVNTNGTIAMSGTTAAAFSMCGTARIGMD